MTYFLKVSRTRIEPRHSSTSAAAYMWGEMPRCGFRKTSSAAALLRCEAAFPESACQLSVTSATFHPPPTADTCTCLSRSDNSKRRHSSLVGVSPQSLTALHHAHGVHGSWIRLRIIYLFIFLLFYIFWSFFPSMINFCSCGITLVSLFSILQQAGEELKWISDSFTKMLPNKSFICPKLYNSAIIIFIYGMKFPLMRSTVWSLNSCFPHEIVQSYSLLFSGTFTHLHAELYRKQLTTALKWFKWVNTVQPESRLTRQTEQSGFSCRPAGVMNIG